MSNDISIKPKQKLITMNFFSKKLPAHNIRQSLPHAYNITKTKIKMRNGNIKNFLFKKINRFMNNKKKKNTKTKRQRIEIHTNKSVGCRFDKAFYHRFHKR